MSEVKYFEREYNYLQAAGEEFANRHKEIGDRLSLKDRHRKDPFVERMLEAFAFLCGRIHERLEDDIPEFAAGFLEQLFPQFLRPFPSCAILQAEAIAGAITKPVVIPRGSEIQTKSGSADVLYKVSAGPIQKEKTEEKSEPGEFIFRTTRAFSVYPMKLRLVKVETMPDGNSALILHFELNNKVSYQALDLKRLPLFLSGDPRLRHTLLFYFARFIKAVAVRELRKPPQAFTELEGIKIGIPELDLELPNGEDHSILPYARQTMTGYRLLQEYFAFRDRFFFIEVRGLDQFAASKECSEFELRFEFSCILSREFQPGLQDILINCTPIVNLFDRFTEPLAVNQHLPEYYIIPDADRRKSREIYSVNGITGVDRNKKSNYYYTPAISYDVLNANDPEYDFKRFYSIVFRPQDEDMGDSYVRLFGPGMGKKLSADGKPAKDETRGDDLFGRNEKIEKLEEEVLSIRATLSNGFLPAKYVNAGIVNQRINWPEGIIAKNINKPTDIFRCPDRKNFLWALIAHLTVNLTTLAETNIFKSILSLYNWSTEENNSNFKKISEGIVRVYPPMADTVYKDRALIRGIAIKVEIDARKFEMGEGDIHLFGLVLSRFLSQYLTINSFLSLIFIDVETKKEYTWEPDQGKISAI